MFFILVALGKSPGGAGQKQQCSFAITITKSFSDSSSHKSGSKSEGVPQSDGEVFGLEVVDTTRPVEELSSGPQSNQMGSSGWRLPSSYKDKPQIGQKRLIN